MPGTNVHNIIFISLPLGRHPLYYQTLNNRYHSPGGAYMNNPIKAVLSAITLVVVAGLCACSDANVEERNSEVAAGAPETIPAANVAPAAAATDEAGQWMSY